MHSQFLEAKSPRIYFASFDITTPSFNICIGYRLQNVVLDFFAICSAGNWTSLFGFNIENACIIFQILYTRGDSGKNLKVLRTLAVVLQLYHPSSGGWLKVIKLPSILLRQIISPPNLKVYYAVSCIAVHSTTTWMSVTNTHQSVKNQINFLSALFFRNPPKKVLFMLPI